MEDISTILSLIGNLGFPAVMCFVLVRMNREFREEHKNEVSELSKSVLAVSETVTKNTLVIEKLLETLGKY